MKKKATQSEAMVKQVRLFIDNNPHINLLKTDLRKLRTQDNNINWGTNARDELISSLYVHQRLLKVHPDPEITEVLIKNGYTSANEIAKKTENSFVKEHAKDFGGSIDKAQQIHRRSVHIRNKTLHLWANVKSVVNAPHFRTMRAANVNEGIASYFESLPSYQDLFGSLDYCACDECKSIFGAAAYFADLMRIIDKCVTEPNRSTIPYPKSHSNPGPLDMRLATRRPDLGKIPLTCAKTNDLVPYIQIVNERLVESLIGTNVEQDIFQTLATSRFPFNTPFNLPLNQIKVYLAQVGISLANIYTLWKADQTTVAREKLDISLEAYTLLTTSAASDPSSYYGVSLSNLNTLTQVELFLKQTDLVFEDLNNLLTQNLSPEELNTTPSIANNFYINGGLKNAYLKLDLGTTPAIIVNLNGNYDAFDRLNRFIRLANILNWSYDQLDWTLRSIPAIGALTIDQTRIVGVSRINELAKNLNIEPLSVCTFFNRIKNYGVGEQEASQAPFDVIFNNPKILNGQLPYHPGLNSLKPDPLNPLYKDSPWDLVPGSIDITVAARISGSLGISVKNLNDLISRFFQAPDKFTVDNLSVLYRHTKLASLLKFPIDQYLILLELNNIASKKVLEFDDVDNLIKTKDLLNASGSNVYELNYFLTGCNPRPYVNPLYPFGDDNKIAAWVNALQKAADTNGSSQKGIDYVTNQLSTYFGTTYELVNSLIAIIVKTTPPPSSLTWQQAFLTPASPPSSLPPYFDYIKNVLLWLSRWLVLVNRLSLATNIIDSLAQYPAAYEFDTAFKDYSLDNIRDLVTFQNLKSTFNDTDNNLLNYIQAVETGATQSAQIAYLSKATGWDLTQTTALLTTIGLGVANLIHQIDVLNQAFGLMENLGGDPLLMSLLEQSSAWNVLDATQWVKYKNLADTILVKIKSQYDINRWSTIATKLEGLIDAKKRAVLLNLKLHQLHAIDPSIKTFNNVYDYLLIDVQMGDSTQISYIKEALNCLQLYLQRCRLRLEVGVEDLEGIHPSWWEWIMNYRIWEANREIFLYPENYLVPSLRKTKTSIFKDLENQLMQADTTESNVQKAYLKYIGDFSQIAKVQIIDSYYATINDPLKGPINTLYLFGRKATDPIGFYVCSQEEGYQWTEWREIKLTINSEYITPIYAFDKLFIFWSELAKSTTSSITASNSINTDVYKANIYYSFQNQDGSWISAQILINDKIVAYNNPVATPIEELPIFKNLFNMGAPIWNKVYAFSSNSSNFKDQVTDLSSNHNGEKLSILYGPFLNNTGKVVDVQPVSEKLDPQQKAFDDFLYDSACNYNRAIIANNNGFVPLIRLDTVGIDLQNDLLIFASEFPLLTENGTNSTINSTAPTFTVQIDNTDNYFQIIQSESVVYDNYMVGMNSNFNPFLPARPVTSDTIKSNVSGITETTAQAVHDALANKNLINKNNFVVSSFKSSIDLNFLAGTGIGLSPAQITEVQRFLFQSMGSLALFKNIAKKNASVIAVKNQPGWFVYDNGDEIFLLSLPTHKENDKLVPAFQKITDGSTLTRPLIWKNSFNVPGIIGGPPPIMSGSIVQALQETGLIDDKGFVDFTIFNDKNLKLALQTLSPTDNQIDIISNIIYDYPIAFQDSFITQKIDQTTSQAIYTNFVTYGIIDVSGIIYTGASKQKIASDSGSGRVNMSIVTSNNLYNALIILIHQKIITQDQIFDIYQTIQMLASAIGYNYWNIDSSTPYKDIHDYVFDATRLTTGAINNLNRSLTLVGIDALLSLDSQQVPVKPILPFGRLQPSQYNINYPNAIDGAQVDFDGLYKLYFWEIFYHIPMLVASSLNTNQQFQDAQKWFSYIFNPTIAESLIDQNTFYTETRGTFSQATSQQIFKLLQSNYIGSDPKQPFLVIDPSTPGKARVNPLFKSNTDLSFLSSTVRIAKYGIDMVRNILLRYEIATPQSHYWQFQPFRNHTLEELIDILSDTNPAVQVYNDDPFDPYAIADLRIGAYEKNTVMQYIDNLIRWGDNLFKQDTWESITEATMLYVYANDLLGPKPVNLGPCKTEKVLTFNDIKSYYEKQGKDIPQFLIDLENVLGDSEDHSLKLNPPGHPFNDLDAYFGVPENQTLVQYWSTVEDRLYKIRNSMNIQGQVRQLALFEPPINPLMLVRMAATSGSITSAISYGDMRVPLYRFTYIIEQAKYLANSLAQLGQSLLLAIEKKDGEDLALLHSTQQSELLNLTTIIKTNQIVELQQNFAGVQNTLEQAQNTQSYYSNLLSTGLSTGEIVNLAAMAEALAFNVGASILKTAASIAYAIPQLGSPFAITYGGEQLGHVIDAASYVPALGAEIANFVAQTSLTVAGYERRAQEWTLQQKTATYEIGNLQQQINSIQTQIASAKQDLTIHVKTIQQEQAIYNFLKTKFSNSELYQWLISNTAMLYYQTYKLALEVALQAQKAYQFELNKYNDKTFINYNYWDSLRKGLLSGEMLSLSLNQMEVDFINHNERSLEIEKTFSLKLNNPQAYLDLKATGTCQFILNEKLFDYDFPGQYARKIKSISVSLPAVVGPYQNINAILSLDKEQMLTKIVDETTAKSVVSYMLSGSGDKPTPGQGYRENTITNQSIALSGGIDDSGMFVLDYNDPRYLPFEGYGAVSSWTLSMPKETNRFNFDVLSDVIINLRYTAFDGGISFRQGVTDLLAQNAYTGALYYNLNQAFSSAWFTFMKDHSSTATQKITFPVSSSSFSYFINTPKLDEVHVKLTYDPSVKLPPLTTTFLTLNSINGFSLPFGLDPNSGTQVIDSTKVPNPFIGNWTISVDLQKIQGTGLLDKDGKFLDPAKFINLELILIYEGQVFKSQRTLEKKAINDNILQTNGMNQAKLDIEKELELVSKN